jgi:hypothetical protein
MNGNPYYVHPGIADPNLLKGLGSLAETLERKRILEAEAEAQEQLRALVPQAMAGDTEALTQVMVGNPQLAQVIQQSIGVRDGQQKQDMRDYLTRFYATPDEEKIAFLQINAGKTPFTWDDELVGMPLDQLKGAANIVAAGLFNKEQMQQILPQPKTHQQATGEELRGYVFDPETGQYSIDPKLKAMLDQKAADAAAAEVPVDAKTRQGINKDVTALLKDARGINTAAKDLIKLQQGSSPTDQLAAIFKFMKSLDPTSVVREGEQQMARSTGGPADALVGYIKQIQGEGGLTPQAFRNMVETAKNLSDSAVVAANIEMQSYLDAYEDTLPQSFKSFLKKRVPALFQTPKVGADGTVVVMVHPEFGEVTESDIKKTMKDTGMTRQQVMDRLRGAGG